MYLLLCRSLLWSTVWTSSVVAERWEHFHWGIRTHFGYSASVLLGSSCAVFHASSHAQEMLSPYGYWPHNLPHWCWADWHRSQGGVTLYMCVICCSCISRTRATVKLTANLMCRAPFCNLLCSSRLLRGTGVSAACICVPSHMYWDCTCKANGWTALWIVTAAQVAYHQCIR